MHKVLAAAFTVAAMVAPGIASSQMPKAVEAAFPDAKQVGEATFSFLFWDVFSGTLWSEDGEFDWDSPFALSLTYFTDFSAAELTDQTIEELDRLTDWPEAKLASFRATVAPCMADVSSGDRFTAVSAEPDQVRLYLNGRETCTFEWPAARRSYFRIWLDDDSRFPERSRQLKGQS